MWVARLKIFNIEYDKDLSPRFNDIYECQKYIDDNLQVLEYLLSEVQHFIDCKIDKKLTFRLGNYIRCYNVEQKRFAVGFDF